MKNRFVTIACCLVAAWAASAAQISYVDWTSATLGTSGSAGGTFTLPDLTTIGVTYTGEVEGAQLGSGGINYWARSSPPPYNNPSYNAYTGVPNMPATEDIIRLRQASILNTITFAAPVKDPIMLILSQGQSGLHVRYDFNRDFVILSSGNGHWGGSPAGSLFEEPGDVLRGVEGHGAIQFLGTFTTISWVVDRAENWHGFTLGLPEQHVPEGGLTLLLLGGGLAGLGVASQRGRS